MQTTRPRAGLPAGSRPATTRRRLYCFFRGGARRLRGGAPRLRRLLTVGLLGLSLALIAQAAAAQWPAQTIHGPATRVALVELFTSEGCSSCPAADRWLSTLASDARLWRDIAPLAFHVDYWDQLGWRDRFSNAGNTSRQRRLAAAGNANGIYTPGIFFDAGEWRGFFRRAALPPTPRGAPGPLTITLGGEGAIVAYAPNPGMATASQPRQAHLALLGFGLRTVVQRGENGGHTLQHDFVVLSWQQRPLQSGAANFNLPVPQSAAGATRLAVVAWVTGADDAPALQAAGGWLAAAR